MSLWIVLFLLGFLVPLYTYFIYPLVVFLLSKFWRCTYHSDNNFLPSVTLIISAYNEERVIRKKMENTLKLDYPRHLLEIIVASEAQDNTNDIVQEYTSQGITLMYFPGRLGKARTLYRTIPLSHGSIIIFSDANAFYRPDVIRKIVRNFSDHSVGCVVGRLQYFGSRHTVGAKGERLYWAYDLFLRKFANQVKGFVPGINGAIFAIRKSLYFPLSSDRGDDYELCTQVAIHGYAVVSEPEAIAEEEASETTQQQFSRKIRVVRWNVMSTLLLMARAVQKRRWLIVFQLFSHRFFRYMVPFCLLMIFLSSAILATHVQIFSFLLIMQILFYAMGLLFLVVERLGWCLPKLCLIPSYFLMVNAAALVAVFLSIQYGQVTTWQKQR